MQRTTPAEVKSFVEKYLLSRPQKILPKLKGERERERESEREN